MAKILLVFFGSVLSGLGERKIFLHFSVFIEKSFVFLLRSFMQIKASQNGLLKLPQVVPTKPNKRLIQ
jgi:hypothetical protein